MGRPGRKIKDPNGVKQDRSVAGRFARLQAAKAANWEIALRRWPSIRGNKGFQLFSDSRKFLLEQLGDDGVEAILREYADRGGVPGDMLAISNERELPLALVQFLIKQERNRRLMEKVEADRARPVLQRFESVRASALHEIEERVATPEKRKALSLEELATIIKACRENINSTMDRTNEGDKPLEIITKLPFPSRKDKEAS